MPLISIIIPVHNEEGNIKQLYKSLHTVLNSITPDFELIFVNDGSSDKSALLLKELCQMDTQVRYLEFSRNFGKEIAMTAGFKAALGDCAITIDADLQHPPALIPDFIKHWRQGNDIVIGLRQKTKNESILKQLGSKLFYKIMNAIADTRLSSGETDYRLLDRKVINEFNQFTEKNRLTRGLIDWLGFKKYYLNFEADERLSGKRSYSYFKLFKLAFLSFVSLSLFPLRLAGYLGSIITIFSGLIITFVVVNQYLFESPFSFVISGVAQIAIAILFLVGIILCCLGLIAMYIGHIHTEVLNRPLYVLSDKKNFNPKQPDGGKVSVI